LRRIGPLGLYVARFRDRGGRRYGPSRGARILDPGRRIGRAGILRGLQLDLLQTRGRYLRSLVDMLSLTRRTSGLPDLVLDHGDHGVVRDASLARTIVVDGIT
jgi:hypothetical protein